MNFYLEVWYNTAGDIMKLEKRLVFRKSFMKRFGILLSILLVGLLFLICYRMFPKTEYKTEDLVTIVKDTKRYDMHLSYPVSHHYDVDREIKRYVQMETNQFLDTIDQDKKEKHHLEITHRTYTYRDFKTIVFLSQGKVATLYYDDNEGTLLKYSDFLKTDQKSFGEMKHAIKSMLLPELFRQQILIDQEKVSQKLEKMDLDDVHFVFHENGVIFFFGKEFSKEIETPIQITLSYAKMWPYIQTKQVRKEDQPTKEELEYTKMGLPNVEGKKLVALTFDDGPGGKTTTALLDGLKARNARVTFFQLGTRAERFPELVARAIHEGHEVGSHTYDHQNLRKLSLEGVQFEITATNQIIGSVTGGSVGLLRPPYGSYDDRTKAAGMPIILWNVDTLDWKLKNKDAILARMKETIKDGDIVLMHDIYQTSVDAALEFIDYARSQGFEFVTVSELAMLRGTELVPGQVYYSLKAK